MSPNSEIARFATQSNHLPSRGNRPRPSLFSPDKHLRLSVSRIGNKSDCEIKETGIEVGRRRQNTEFLYGWGRLAISTVYETGLDIKHDNDPPDHSHIIDWPEDKVARKDRQKALARNSIKYKLPERIYVG